MSAPPMIGAATADRPITGPKAAKALVISSSAKTSLIIPNPCGIRQRAERALHNAEADRTPEDGAAAQNTEAIVKPTMPTMNSFRRPTRSPSRAPMIRNTANASV